MCIALHPHPPNPAACIAEEHKEFLRAVLLPLHKATNLHLFHLQVAVA